MQSYKDRNSVGERIKSMIEKLTLDEKISLLYEALPDIPKIGLRKYRINNECLHGIIRPGKATVFPQAIALAATWNTELIFNIATAISDEARAKYHSIDDEVQYSYGGCLTFFSPVVNMARDPRWGRTQETYGEDPFLTSRMAVSFIKGLQGNHATYLKTIATPKHFAANNEEHNRFECNAQISEKTLFEYYLPAFHAGIVEAGAGSIMCAYNAINAIPCHANRMLLTDILRNEWGFDGYVISDAGGVKFLLEKHKFVSSPEENAAQALKAGIDIELSSKIYQQHLKKAIKMGLVDKDYVDSSAGRVLKALMRLGLFEAKENNPFSKISSKVVGSKKHSELALKAARESIVLLKNKGISGKKLLPLDISKIKSIAVVGNNANQSLFGHYSGKPVRKAISPLQAIVSQTNLKIRHVNYEYHRKNQLTVMKSSQGFYGEYFENDNLDGKPAFTRMDESINFHWQWWFDPFVTANEVSMRWSTCFTPKVAGIYHFQPRGLDGFRFYINEQIIEDQWRKPENAPEKIRFRMKKGEEYKIQIEYKSRSKNNRFAELNWIQPIDPLANAFAREVAAAKECDAAIAVIGLDTTIESEGLDRKDITLPSEQEKLVKKIFQANPNTIVVLESGSALAVNWIHENIPAIIHAWYPGQEGGSAIVDVIMGKYNPAGRLPITFYKSIKHIAAFDDYEISHGKTYMYLKKRALYPFGHGLSYTEFRYNNLKVDVIKDPKVLFRTWIEVENTGETAGDEVVQVYIRKISNGDTNPIHKLVGFKRIYLGKGRKKTVEIQITRDSIAVFDEKQKTFLLEKGKYELQVGSSSYDLRLKEILSLSLNEKIKYASR